MNRWWLPACLVAALLAAACGEPPTKEMGQAQGAIDAARAAGADKYATTSYTAAVEALRRSEAAVTNRDYRLALSTALDSREYAQTAAREAVDEKARRRGEAERTLAQIATTLAQANTRVQDAQKARVPQRLLRQPQAELAAVNGDVQKAGEAIEAGDYVTATPLLDGVKARIDKVIAALDAIAASQSARRRR